MWPLDWYMVRATTDLWVRYSGYTGKTGKDYLSKVVYYMKRIVTCDGKNGAYWDEFQGGGGKQDASGPTMDAFKHPTEYAQKPSSKVPSMLFVRSNKAADRSASVHSSKLSRMFGHSTAGDASGQKNEGQEDDGADEVMEGDSEDVDLLGGTEPFASDAPSRGSDTDGLRDTSQSGGRSPQAARSLSDKTATGHGANAAGTGVHPTHGPPRRQGVDGSSTATQARATGKGSVASAPASQRGGRPRNAARGRRPS